MNRLKQLTLNENESKRIDGTPCRKILKDGGYELEISNDEIKELRDYLYWIAQYQVDFECVEENNNEIKMIA